MREIIVSANEAGQRFDKMLTKYLKEAPKSFLYRMLRKKNIELNGKKAVGNERLKEGDCIRLFLSEETIEKFSSAPVKRAAGKPDLIYEDEQILVVNKPAGLLSQRADGQEESLVEQVITYLLDSGQITEAQLQTFRPSVCSRLDRNTSGLVVAGKSLAGLQEMSRLLRDRSIRKFYRCLVAGEVREKRHVKGYLTKDTGQNKVEIRPEQEKDALAVETAYEPLLSNGRTTLLEVELITGRSHQIRAHLASEGHPVIGDPKYGDRAVNDAFQKRYGLKSQLLHAYRLEMPALAAPFESVSRRTFTAPLPALFEKILEEEYKGLR